MHPRARALRWAYLLATLWLVGCAGIVGLLASDFAATALTLGLLAIGHVGAAFISDSSRLLPRGGRFSALERRALTIAGAVGIVAVGLASWAIASPDASGPLIAATSLSVAVLAFSLSRLVR